MRRRNPDKGLNLIGDAAAEDSSAKYFLAMLKYRCNPVDPEAWHYSRKSVAARQPPDGQWKNPNLRWLRYPVKQDLDNIAWWYWLDDVTTTTTFRCCMSRISTSAFWAAGCRRYGPDTKQIIYYCSAECHIYHEFDLWTRKFRPVVEYAVSRMNIGM